MPSDSLRKDSNAPPEACVEVLASVVRPETVESKVLRYCCVAVVSLTSEWAAYHGRSHRFPISVDTVSYYSDVRRI